jgi:hypothetical protein
VRTRKNEARKEEDDKQRIRHEKLGKEDKIKLDST